MPSQYFVRASIDPSGQFASCLYFYDYAAKQPVEGDRLVIPQQAGGCTIGQAEGSALTLLGAVFKTLGHPASMNDKNFTPSNDEGMVVIPMPTTNTVEKGVVLMFSNAGQVDGLYASTDPVVVNSDD
ncbi:hypothetical protein [Roseateles sp.]|uniref:hypothetical protein n=1 Tax=Roseateles sp. TaxID=1971397 RepID=UPI0025DB75D9|nr:hypothetical protein [Roseateles sp.]MBV8033504.1 hypothetical protein [Roseateles sp.]